jgi:hypothetical protein
MGSPGHDVSPTTPKGWESTSVLRAEEAEQVDTTTPVVSSIF